MKKVISIINDFLGIDFDRVSHTERLVSALGGFLGIFGVYLLSLQFLSSQAAILIVASMGSSAVLLFAVPHGKLSQPWALLGGHTISALVSVTVAMQVDNIYLAAGLAVGLSIGAMHYARCTHPPGGATALTAVIGGPSVTELGYQFVLSPILLNTFFIFIIAILFNYVFHWRRYPASLMSDKELGFEARHDQAGAINLSTFNEGDLRYAAKKMDLTLDITHDDLIRLYALASQHAMSRHVEPEDLKLGSYYSNGLYGKLWSVRQIIDESDDVLIYKGVAGAERRQNASSTRDEFAKWARFEVDNENNQWQRIEQQTEQD